MRSWSIEASDVRNDPVIAAESADRLRSQGIKETVSYERIIGCPHEEGCHFPNKTSCSHGPPCPVELRAVEWYRPATHR